MNEEIINNNYRKKKKRLTRKIAFLFMISSVTAIVLIVETYAWFVGTGRVTTSSFQIGVSTEENLMLSLDGTTWTTNLQMSQDAILGTAASGHKAYEGNTNHWTGEDGLIPVSSSGQIDTDVSRLKLYQKYSLTATQGGYRISATRVDNYSEADGGGYVTEQDGYVAFDLFVKNGSDGYYIEEYNALDNEAIYLTTNSSVTAEASGGSGANTYGLANSVRVAFVQIGRVAGSVDTAGTITSISCSDVEGSVTGLCEDVTPTIWEPNETSHDSNLVSYFNGLCKKKTVTGEAPNQTITYSGSCTPVAAADEGDDPTQLTASSYVPTYSVNADITAEDRVEIYDGLNGVAAPAKFTNYDTFTDSEKSLTEENRPAFLMLAPNSITKIRVYIYLEGQDVDNYDLISLGSAINVQFGFTKDQRDLMNGIS